MKQPVDESHSPTLFRKTGLLFACLCGAYLLMYLVFELFGGDYPPGFEAGEGLIPISAVCSLLFIVSAMHGSVAWLQPLILLIMTPFAIARYGASSMYGLGAFIAAEILLYRLGFFGRHKLLKFLITIAYFFTCEIFIGRISGTAALPIAMTILFMTSFLTFLLIVYGGKWVVYLKMPKPPLSLSTKNLTKKESEYLRAVLGGRSLKEVAIDDGVTESTVRNTMARVYRKFDVHDKSALMAKCENYSIMD